MRFLTVGESSLLIECQDLKSAMSLFAVIQVSRSQSGNALAMLTQVVPAARTVLVRFDRLKICADAVIAAIEALDTGSAASAAAHHIVVPTVYSGDDLDAVAHLLGISRDQVVQRHTQTAWRAAFVGFAPGFAYLTGGDPIFDVPRRSTPRVAVPAGAVGLAGTFSGVYPRVSSGGWQLIGVTDLSLWNERHDPPALIAPGDVVQFRAVRNKTVLQEAVERPVRETSQDSQTPVEPEPAPSSQEESALRRESADGLVVDQPGMLAIFEDDGRNASSMGVTHAGAADPQALHLSNLLVGNPEGAAAIELLNGHAQFTAVGTQVVSVTGAPVTLTIHGADDATTSVEGQQAFVLLDGERLEVGAVQSGLRNYLALQSGFDVRPVLDSASYDTMSRIGPRPLMPGDLLACSHAPITTTGLPQPWPQLPTRGEPTELRTIAGPHDDWFTREGLQVLYDQPWTVTSTSNRVGLRLHGQQGLKRAITDELPSEGMVEGAIEIPTDGQPVVFLNDHPVTGGYPVAAVLTEDAMALVGQLPVGALIRFTRSSQQ